MKLEEVKIGMHIADLNYNQVYTITKINEKSVTCNYTNIKETELAHYVIVEEAIAKARTIKKVFEKECSSLNSLTYRIRDLGDILVKYKDYLSLNNDYLSKEIEDTLEQVRNAIKEVLE